jgi:hypothetical protein
MAERRCNTVLQMKKHSIRTAMKMREHGAGGIETDGGGYSREMLEDGRDNVEEEAMGENESLADLALAELRDSWAALKGPSLAALRDGLVALLTVAGPSLVDVVSDVVLAITYWLVCSWCRSPALPPRAETLSTEPSPSSSLFCRGSTGGHSETMSLSHCPTGGCPTSSPISATRSSWCPTR